MKISKPEIFRAIQFLPAKNSVPAKESTSEAYRFRSLFLIFGPENFRAENFLGRIFLGVKNLSPIFFGCEIFCPEIFAFEIFFKIFSCIETKRRKKIL